MSYQDHVVDANIRGLSRFSYTSVTGDKKTYYRVGDTGLFSAVRGLAGGRSRTRSKRRSRSKSPKRKGTKKAKKTYVGCHYQKYDRKHHKNVVKGESYRKCIPTDSLTKAEKSKEMCTAYRKKNQNSKRKSCRGTALSKKLSCTLKSNGRCKADKGKQSSKCVAYKKGNRCSLTKEELKKRRAKAYEKNKPVILGRAKAKRVVKKIMKKKAAAKASGKAKLKRAVRKITAKRKAKRKSPTRRSRSRR